MWRSDNLSDKPSILILYTEQQGITSDGLATSFSSAYFAHGPRKLSISSASPPLTFFLFSVFFCPLSNTVSPGGRATRPYDSESPLNNTSYSISNLLNKVWCTQSDADKSIRNKAWWMLTFIFLSLIQCTNVASRGYLVCVHRWI